MAVPRATRTGQQTQAPTLAFPSADAPVGHTMENTSDREHYFSLVEALIFGNSGNSSSADTSMVDIVGA